MTIDSIELYEELKQKIGEKEAKDLLGYIEESVRTGAATKEDVALLRGDLAKLDGKVDLFRTELDARITNLKTDLEGKIANLATDLEGKIATLKTEFTGSLTSLAGKFQLYFAALAGLVVLTNPKVLDLFSKLLGLVK